MLYPPSEGAADIATTTYRNEQRVKGGYVLDTHFRGISMQNTIFPKYTHRMIREHFSGSS